MYAKTIIPRLWIMLITYKYSMKSIFPASQALQNTQFDGREWWYVNEAAIAIIKPLGIIQSGTGRLVIDVIQ
jgi:hypothetical protein